VHFLYELRVKMRLSLEAPHRESYSRREGKASHVYTSEVDGDE